jgi:hypothetical protein
MTARAQHALLATLGVLASFTVVGIWLASPALGHRAPRKASLEHAFMQAVNRVASAPAVHYVTASRGVSLAVDVTPDGYAFGDGVVDGVPVAVMRVGGRTYVTSSTSAPPRLTRKRAAAQVVGHWIAGVPFYEASMRQFPASDELALTLWRAVRSRAASFRTVCLGPRVALRASTPRGVLYVSRSAPHRVLRWVPGKRAASRTHNKRPRRGHCRSRTRARAASNATLRTTVSPGGVHFNKQVVLQRSLAQPSGDRGRRVPRASAASAMHVHRAASTRPEARARTALATAPPLDTQADSQADARQLYQDLLDHAPELGQAFDDSVHFSLSELGGPLTCAGAECTSLLLVKTVTTPASATGTIALSANGEFTANGIPIGTCAAEGVAPPNGVTTLPCTAATPALPEILAASEGPVLVQATGTITGIATLSVDVQAKIDGIEKSEGEDLPPDNPTGTTCAMRLQVQQGSLNLSSVPILSAKPITVAEAVSALTVLRASLSSRMRKAAEQAFARTRKWIVGRPAQGGVAAIGNVRRDHFVFDKANWRLDTENLRCVNLVT